MIARIAVLGVALVALSGVAYAKPMTLKFAYFGGPKSPTYSRVMVPWAKDISDASKGTVKIDTYPGGALGRNPRAQVKLVLDGVIDIAFFVPSYTPGRFPDTQVMELPGLIDNSFESGIALWRMYDKGLMRGFDKFKVLMLVTTHPYSIHTKFPVRRIADLKGKKLRAGGPVAGATLRALGAIPVGMPISTVAQNISKGIISGSAVDWNVLYAFRIIDVAKYHYMGLLGTVPIGILMSKKKWDTLPPAAQAAFDKYSGEALARRNGKVNIQVQTALEAKTRKNPDHVVVDLDAAAKKQWAATVNPVVDQWAKKSPKNQVLLSALRKELAAIRAGM
jgi:TRAP-type C4-dicarboxylate transport system substrate-binding protein